jgi:hypothetical protein
MDKAVNLVMLHKIKNHEYLPIIDQFNRLKDRRMIIFGLSFRIRTSREKSELSERFGKLPLTELFTWCSGFVPSCRIEISA